jgi:hypothetical protein
MRTSDEYQAKAAECIRLAQTIALTSSKAMLLEMAQAWVKLAEYARDKEAEATPRFKVAATA